jgi:hypothetical protein
MMSMAAFPQEQVAVTETTWTSVPKIFTLWPLQTEIC